MTTGELTAVAIVFLTIIGGVAGWLRLSIATAKDGTSALGRELRHEWTKDMSSCTKLCDISYAPRTDLVRLEERIKGIESHLAEIKDDVRDILHVLRRGESDGSP